MVLCQEGTSVGLSGSRKAVSPAFTDLQLAVCVRRQAGAASSVCLRVEFPLDTQEDKIHRSHISPLLLSGWSITPELCNITHIHTGRNQNNDGDLIDKGKIRILQHGRESTGSDSQEREIIGTHTHTNRHTIFYNTYSHSDGEICLPVQRCTLLYSSCQQGTVRFIQMNSKRQGNKTSLIFWFSYYFCNISFFFSRWAE